MSRSVVLNVPGKINLSLEVLGRRADGYHEIAGIFATIDLRDRVRVAHARNLDVRVSPPVVGEDLSARAVNALAGATGRAPHAHVRVRKRIPVAAGLGGGSADAAAVLRGLARLWRVDGIDLCAVGAGIGSDVPFFASAAPFALVRGRGELVEPLPMPAVPLWIVLVNVAGQVSTAAVFATVSARRAQSTHATAIATMLREGGATPADLRAHLVNDLRDAAERIAPSIREARDAARAIGIELAMSGSGGSLFALADDRAHALRLARRLRRAGLNSRPLTLGVHA